MPRLKRDSFSYDQPVPERSNLRCLLEFFKEEYGACWIPSPTKPKWNMSPIIIGDMVLDVNVVAPNSIGESLDYIWHFNYNRYLNLSKYLLIPKLWRIILDDGIYIKYATPPVARSSILVDLMKPNSFDTIKKEIDRMKAIKPVKFSLNDKVRILDMGGVTSEKVYKVVTVGPSMSSLELDGSQSTYHNSRIVEVVESTSKTEDTTNSELEHWSKKPTNKNKFTTSQEIVSHVIIDKEAGVYYYYNSYNGEHSEKSKKKAALKSYDKKVKQLRAKGYERHQD